MASRKNGQVQPNLFQAGVNALVDRVQKAPWVALAVAIGLTALSGFYAAGNLKIDTDTAGMISEDLPFRQRFKAFRHAFPTLSDNVAIVIDADVPDRADRAADRLAARLRADPDRFPLVFSPETHPFFLRSGLLYLGLDDLTGLADDLADSQPFLSTLAADPSLRGLAGVLKDALDGAENDDQARRIASVLNRISEAAAATAEGKSAPLSWRNLINTSLDEGTNRRVIVTKPKVDFGSLSPAAEAMARIRTLARDVGLTEEAGVTVRLTGGVVISTEELESVKNGATNAGLVSLVLVAILLAWGIRSLRLVLGILAALICGLLWTAGFTTLAIGHLNLVSVAFAVLFIGLGVDFGIHFALRFREERLGAGDQREVMRRTGHGLAMPLGLSATAAAISFFSFIPTDYRGLSELGLIAGAGMFIAFAATFTVIPAFLSLLPPSAPRTALATRSFGWSDHRIATGALALGAICAAVVPFARFDLDPIKLRDPSTESVRTFRDLAATPGLSPYTIEVLANSLSDAYEVAGKLRLLPQVDKVVTAANLVPVEQEEKLAIVADLNIFYATLGTSDPVPVTEAERGAAFEVLRQTLQRAADRPLKELSDAARKLDARMEKLSDPEQRIAFEKDVFEFFAPQVERLKLALSARPVALKDLPPEVLGRYLAPSGRARVQVYPSENLEDPDALARFVVAVREISPAATDSPVEILEAGRAVVNSVVTAALISIVAVSAMVFAMMRSVRDTLLVLIPLILAALYTVAATVALGMPFNFANVIVLPLLMGLGVASGIHLVSRAREEHSGTVAFATSTPRAVTFSALTTIASFGSLAVSSHRGTASMGELLMLSIGLTLVCTLIVLPSLMQLWPARKSG
jgi:hopanoid biosynthesis associated RND transporter like protein HpnN